MTKLEELEEYIVQEGILLNDTILLPNECVDGLYVCWPNHLMMILVKRSLSDHDRYAVLLEELAHHKCSGGSILRADPCTAKSEHRGRVLAYKAMLPQILDAMRWSDASLYSVAEEIGLPERFVREALAWAVVIDRGKRCGYR